MKDHSSHLPRMTQPLTPEALMHIADLAECDGGLAERCAHYRRRASVLRLSVAACLMAVVAFGINSVYSQQSRYTEIIKNSPIDNDYICESINTTLNHI